MENQISFGMIHPSSSSSSMRAPAGSSAAAIATGFMNNNNNNTNSAAVKEMSSSTSTGAPYHDLGELDDQELVYMYFEGNQQHHQQQHDLHLHPSSSPATAAAAASATPHHEHHRHVAETLNIFPSQPMHVDPSSTKSGIISMVSASINSSKRPTDQQKNMENTNQSPKDTKTTVKKDGNKKTTANNDRDGPKTSDPKTLRRLAQNREAARKSRLRKKAYVQQLENSRIRLTQLEQELQRARAQGMFFGGGVLHGDQSLPTGIGALSSDAAMFDMEYARWLEDHHRLMCELRAAVQEHLPDSELKLYVDNCLAHYDELINLKAMVAKTDVFHLVSGMWKTPAERCFLWLGGFRPSEIIKIVVGHIDPLTEQQVVGVCALQQSAQETEEALNQGLDALNRSLSDAITSDHLSYPSNMANYMGQMAVAMNRLTSVEGFIRQADNLRQQTLHRLQQLLTTRQSARCFLAVGEHFHRLRALSSLWLSRPRQD